MMLKRVKMDMSLSSSTLHDPKSNCSVTDFLFCAETQLEMNSLKSLREHVIKATQISELITV
jgi:hypothetical protein